MVGASKDKPSTHSPPTLIQSTSIYQIKSNKAKHSMPTTKLDATGGKRPRRKSSIKKKGVLEWTGWKREPSQRALLISPKVIPRGSMTSNVPQFWEEGKDQTNAQNNDSSTTITTANSKEGNDGNGVMVKKQEECFNPFATLLHLMSNIFGLLSGLFGKE